MDQYYLLGSTSSYRAELLSRLQLPFSTASPTCCETPLPSEQPGKLASRLAQTKALSLQSEHPNAIIIGSDQVAALGDGVLGKPGTPGKARQQLRVMRGKSVVFYTAVSVIDCRSGQILNAIDETIATLRHLSDAEIDRYVKVESPLDCAGSFKIEKLGISLFERVESDDPSALVGLPLIKLCQCLRKPMPYRCHTDAIEQCHQVNNTKWCKF